ncbi:MAG: hypothetical protein AMXMBFR84_09950 [Candidatus Hydrogenedentota bacterium]
MADERACGISDAAVGLCLSCRHARRIRHPHGGNDYWRCGLSDVDSRFPKYPRLPVSDCEGFERIESS